MKLLTTAEAASLLGITPQRVRALIAAGRLLARHQGRDLLIDERHLALVAVRVTGNVAKPTPCRRCGEPQPTARAAWVHCRKKREKSA